MGDHRVNCKIEAEFHGVKKKIELDVNWTEAYQVPYAVYEFFQELYSLGYDRYEDSMAEYHREQKEKDERKEYERLKSKFDGIK